MVNANFGEYSDILDVNDVSKLLGISKRSAREFMRENGGVMIAGKWLIGKVIIVEMFNSAA